MITKSSFIEATYKQFNSIREYEGYLIGMVAFHSDREWKIVDTKEFDVISDRSYKPIAQFRLRDELWNYIKSNV